MCLGVVYDLLDCPSGTSSQVFTTEPIHLGFLPHSYQYTRVVSSHCDGKKVNNQKLLNNCEYWMYCFYPATDDNDILDASTTQCIPNACSSDKITKKSASRHSSPLEYSLNHFVADQRLYTLSDIEDTQDTKTLMLIIVPRYFKW